MLDRTPVIDSFSIRGLHGYKNVEVDFSGPARIVVAENGMGKTTILSAISSFLQCDFDSLRRLNFDSIQCKFSGYPSPLVLSKEHLGQTPDPGLEQLLNLSKYSSNTLATVQRSVLSVPKSSIAANIHADATLQEIYMQSPYSLEEVTQYILEAKSQFEATASPKIQSIVQEIAIAVGSREIVYLPTYRRVEMALQGANREHTKASPVTVFRPKESHFQKIKDLGIRFGLADVEERIASITKDIQVRSNFGYRTFSANIIDELLAPSHDDAGVPTLPDLDSLARFFHRIDQYSHGSSHASARIKTLRFLYETGKIASTENNWLRYFLSQLNSVIERTTELEGSIEQFVARVNSYLTISSEEKELRYDPVRMKVVVTNMWTQEDIKMDDLSSGEKQVISIFSYLYLHPKKKILLIDEPELSLSIEWQRRLLPDVISAPGCDQLLAITHSPFIYDNELDPYAGPLMIKRYNKRGS